MPWEAMIVQRDLSPEDEACTSARSEKSPSPIAVWFRSYRRSISRPVKLVGTGQHGSKTLER